jgi:hypothetical protein
MNKNTEKILGWMLLTPPLVSVLLFFIALTGSDTLKKFDDFESWTGSINYYADAGGGGGYTSALPLYFGLMAIAGAYLIKEKS